MYTVYKWKIFIGYYEICKQLKQPSLQMQINRLWYLTKTYITISLKTFSPLFITMSRNDFTRKTFEQELGYQRLFR